MAEPSGRAGRRAELARLLHRRLVEQASTFWKARRANIDAKAAQLAADLGISGAVALRHFNDQHVVEQA